MFLVDRGRNKRKWWTYDLDEAIIFRKPEAALFQLRKLNHNNPSVISYKSAKLIELNQRDIVDVIDDHDQSWDAHKDY